MLGQEATQRPRPPPAALRLGDSPWKVERRLSVPLGTPRERRPFWGARSSVRKLPFLLRIRMSPQM